MSDQKATADELPIAAWRNALDGPDERPFEFLDARELPPPEPLKETLERLPELGSETVFVQLNDREPKLLFPKLDDRGYEHDTAAVEEGVVTVIWE